MRWSTWCDGYGVDLSHRDYEVLVGGRTNEEKPNARPKTTRVHHAARRRGGGARTSMIAARANNCHGSRLFWAVGQFFCARLGRLGDGLLICPILVVADPVTCWECRTSRCWGLRDARAIKRSSVGVLGWRPWA